LVARGSTHHLPAIAATDDLRELHNPELVFVT
jgi:hypothetical protein